jgi:16S rRNA (cytidine1402-2'-O)-methyltransferase
VLVERLLRGNDVALVSDAGTPAVSDPGGLLIRTAIGAGIRVEPVPGPSAAIAALIASGLPSDTFTFLGFPPTKANARSKWFNQLRHAGRTVVFFEAPHRIRRTLQDLQKAVGDQAIAVAREMTKAHEELVRGPISNVLGRLMAPRGEFTVVVGFGHTTEYVPADGCQATLSEPEIVAEVGRTAELMGLSTRRAVSLVAKRHGLRPNEVYAAVERSLKLVTRQNGG